MKKIFEYYVILSKVNDNVDLNNFGKDGWELISVVGTNQDQYSYFYFKREIKPINLNG